MYNLRNRRKQKIYKSRYHNSFLKPFDSKRDSNTSYNNHTYFEPENVKYWQENSSSLKPISVDSIKHVEKSEQLIPESLICNTEIEKQAVVDKVIPDPVLPGSCDKSEHDDIIKHINTYFDKVNDKLDNIKVLLDKLVEPIEFNRKRKSLIDLGEISDNQEIEKLSPDGNIALENVSKEDLCIDIENM